MHEGGKFSLVGLSLMTAISRRAFSVYGTDTKRHWYTALRRSNRYNCAVYSNEREANYAMTAISEFKEGLYRRQSLL